jgi:uncharacterized protein
MKRNILNIILSANLFLFNALPVKAGIVSYRMLKYQQTTGQTSVYSCGAAAISTLLTYFYDVPTSESEILEISKEVMQKNGKRPEDSGISALALKQSLAVKGINAEVRESSLEQIRLYFQKGGLPLVLHTTIPQQHYIVAIGIVEDWLIIADPSSGRKLIPVEMLKHEKGFSGMVIMPKPSYEFAQTARQRQQFSKDWADNRLRQFQAMKRSIL